MPMSRIVRRRTALHRTALARAVAVTSLSAAALSLAACGDQSAVAPSFDASLARGANAATVRVTSNADAGAGSFRAAVAAAAASPAIKFIVFDDGLGTIRLTAPVTYGGRQQLSIAGANAVLDATDANGPAFRSTGGANLSFTRLTVQGSPSEGIDIQVPATATGTVQLELDRVVVQDNRGHGVLLNDQLDPSTTDDVEPDPRGSAASLLVRVSRTRFLRNGFSVSDRDGLRVNEGGDGSLRFEADAVWAEDNAADGIELDERGAGDVEMRVTTLTVRRNGIFDPADLDDGFDVDENGDGSIVGTIRHSSAIDNYEEGFDFNENNAGDLRVDFDHVVATGNGEEGIDLEEDDDFAGGGDLVTTAVDVEANRNGGDGGLKIREKGDGSLAAELRKIVANDNSDAGISVREDGEGHLDVTGEETETNGNVRGLDLYERAAGNFTGVWTDGIATGNERGLRVRQELSGTGTLLLTNVSSTGNAAADQFVNVIVTGSIIP